MRFYTTEQLGPKQAMLPSGALLCSDVTIARTGVQHYHPSEIGAEGAEMIAVQRDAEEVFAPEAIASFEGAPVTMTHPFDGVGPANWSAFAVGHVQNVRRQAARDVYGSDRRSPRPPARAARIPVPTLRDHRACLSELLLLRPASSPLSPLRLPDPNIACLLGSGAAPRAEGEGIAAP